MGFSERFTVNRVSNRELARPPSAANGEVALNVTELNERRNTRTVPASFANEYDRRKSSFAQLTREPLPRLEYYRTSKRGLKRPSIGELHGDLEQKPEAAEDDEKPAEHGHGIKLGWIQGVLIPCLLNIWGVMLFLRLSWVVAQSGIAWTLVIIGLSYLVCVITTLSLSAICTNGDVKGGGIYYLISRSLGPEFGASVGIVFAFANAVAASMNTIGFCSSLNDLLKSFNTKIVDGGVNDIRIVGTVAILVMVIICAVGMDWEAKAQNFLVATIVIAIFNFIIGTIIGPGNDNVEKAQGFVGISVATFEQNMGPDYRYSEGMDQDFFSVFAIFFPSVTGIQAGANICGDLKDPASAIPKGTLLALLISGISYIAFVFFAGAAAVRDATGNVTDIINGTLVAPCAANHTCEFGLQNSYTIMQLMSLSSAVIYAGCFAATLSTALTNLLSVPRLIQALGLDRIYPGLIFFSKGYGKHGEPYRGYVLVFIVSTLFLLIAELNAIAPLISNFYLASYALINFCTFHASMVKPLGWRPTFRFYNAWLSLFGCIICVAIMFLIDILSSVITIGIIFMLYWIVVYRKPDVNWGSSTQAQTYKSALTSALRLQHIGEHVKNYHPQILVLSGHPQNRPPLIDLANLITKNNSLLIVGDIMKQRLSHRRRQLMLKEGNKFLNARKIKSFYNIVDGVGFADGVRSLIQASGFGKMMPNILLMGYKSDWKTCERKDLLTYFSVLHDAFDSRMAVAILRLPNGLDYSHLTTDILPGQINHGMIPNLSTANFNTIGGDEDIPGLNPARNLMHADSNLNLASMAGSNNTTLVVPQPAPMPNQKKLKELKEKDHNIIYSTRGGSCVPKEVLNALSLFQKKQPKGTIDVWWLYDDGGLTMLIPYIISNRSNWANCKVRVFALTNHKMELEVEERNMANLLSKLRIDYSSLTMLQGVNDKPQDMTIDMHNKLIDGFVEDHETNCFVSDTEKASLQEKTNRQLRLREMLLEHSNNASLIVMSMPMPRQGSVSAPLYMSWLEMLTKDMPPFVLVRGNQNSVLTFYS